MITIEKLEIGHFEAAFRGMRNPMQSHKESDSVFGLMTFDDVEAFIEQYFIESVPGYVDLRDAELDNLFNEMIQKTTLAENVDDEIVNFAFVGPKDLYRAQQLVITGTDHGKFLRQITVSMDITAPLYWWKEMDTYKVGTVANSCSTMHKLASTPITRECFSFDNTDSFSPLITDLFDDLIQDLEKIRKSYLETKDIRYWRALIQLLPSSWNQKRTWSANYLVLRNIYFARKNHKLIEWHKFCQEIEKMPWGKELICVNILPEKN